jgi:hypothetical protein
MPSLPSKPKPRRTLLLWPAAAGALSSADERKLAAGGFDVIRCTNPHLVKPLSPVHDPEVLAVLAEGALKWSNLKEGVGAVIIKRIFDQALGDK